MQPGWPPAEPSPPPAPPTGGNRKRTTVVIVSVVGALVLLCCGVVGVAGAYFAGVFADDGPYQTRPDPCPIIDKGALSGFIAKPDLTNSNEPDVVPAICEVRDGADNPDNARVDLRLFRVTNDGSTDAVEMARKNMAQRRTWSVYTSTEAVPDLGDEAFTAVRRDDPANPGVWAETHVRVGNLILQMNAGIDDPDGNDDATRDGPPTEVSMALAEKAVKRLPPP